MQKKRVVFIEPEGSESNVFEHYMGLPLMGTLYLGTILHNKGYDVKVYNENIMEGEFDPYQVNADVFCISCLTVSANRGKILAHELKQLNPESRIIIGGIHASLNPETFEDVADQIVSGEAETVIEDVVEGNLEGFRVKGEPLRDLDQLPLVNYSLLENSLSMSIIPIMTSRGCPFDCNFCTVTQIFGRKFRMQSPERIIQEVENALAHFKTKTVFFYDDNFSSNRKRVNRVCDLIIERGIDILWVTQVRSDLAKDPALLQKMQEAGCSYFFIGFESIDDETLEAMNKSQTRKDIERAIDVVHKHGISIHGMFIFGEDHDTPESLQRTVDFAIEHHIDTVQFMIITPFPSTRFYNQMEEQGRILHKRWEYFSALYTVIRPAKMSPYTLQRETVKAYERFYSMRRFVIDALRFLIDISLDAVTLNFRASYKYNIDVMFLKAGARFLVGRYAKTFDSYYKFLNEVQERKILGE